MWCVRSSVGWCLYACLYSACAVSEKKSGCEPISLPNVENTSDNNAINSYCEYTLYNTFSLYIHTLYCTLDVTHFTWVLNCVLCCADITVLSLVFPVASALTLIVATCACVYGFWSHKRRSTLLFASLFYVTAGQYSLSPPPPHTHTQTYTGTGLVWKKLKSCQFHATPCKSCKMINKLECCKTSPIVENDHHFSLVFVLFFPKQCRAHPHFTYYVHVHYPV